MTNLPRALNALFIYMLCTILLASFFHQFVQSDLPCDLCLMQRLCMVATAIALLMNLRFGVKPQHYGLALFSCLTGTLIAAYQTCLNISPSTPPPGAPILGLSLYVWSLIIFFISMFAIGLLLILYGKIDSRSNKPSWKSLEIIALVYIALIIVLCLLTTIG